MSKKRGRPKIKFNNFTVKFSLDAFIKIKKYCELAGKDEWLGFLLRDEDNTTENTVTVTDVYFPPQTIGGASCKLDADKFADEIVKLISTEKGKAMLPKFCGWIHSHCDMDVFFSATDVEANNIMRQYMPQSKIFISTVVNNELRFLGKSIIKTNGKDYMVDNVNFVLDYNNFKKIEKFCTKEFKKARQEIAVKVPVQFYHGVYHNHGAKNYTYKRSPRIPKKFRKTLKIKMISKIIIVENNCVMLKALPSTIKDFIKKNKIRNKLHKQVVQFIFRGLYHRKFKELQVFEIFGKNYVPPKKKVKQFVHRDSKHRPISKDGWKLWKDDQDYEELSFDEYQRKKWEDGGYGY